MLFSRSRRRGSSHSAVDAGSGRADRARFRSRRDGGSAAGEPHREPDATWSRRSTRRITGSPIRSPPRRRSTSRSARATASYYGHELAGNRTASGERFNPNGADRRPPHPAARHQVPGHQRRQRPERHRPDQRPRPVRRQARLIDVSLGAAREIHMVRVRHGPGPPGARPDTDCRWLPSSRRKPDDARADPPQSLRPRSRLRRDDGALRQQGC